METNYFSPTELFTDSETVVAVKLAELFLNHDNPIILKTLVSVEKPSPQEPQPDNVVVVVRNGGALTNNGLSREEIFTIQIWSKDYDENQLVAVHAEYLFSQITGDGVARCWVESPQRRAETGGKEFFRFFTANVMVFGGTQ